MLYCLTMGKLQISTPRLSLMYLSCEYVYYKLLFSNWNATYLLSLQDIHAEARLFFERWQEEERRREDMKRWHLCRAADYCPNECPCEILELNVNSLFCCSGPIWSRFLHEARFFSFFFTHSSFFCSLCRFFFRSLVTLNWRFLKNRSFVPLCIFFVS